MTQRPTNHSPLTARYPSLQTYNIFLNNGPAGGDAAKTE